MKNKKKLGEEDINMLFDVVVYMQHNNAHLVLIGEKASRKPLEKVSRQYCQEFFATHM